MNRERQHSIQSFAFVLSACMAVGFCRGLVPDSVVVGSAVVPHEIELESRINPNVAPVESLLRLPGLGIGRARAIAAYREEFEQVKGADCVFECCDDLQEVNGIGPRTVQDLRDWIKFE